MNKNTHRFENQSARTPVAAVQIPNWSGLWLVEWNERQRMFHVETADTRFMDSIASFYKKQKCDPWISLGIFNSYEEAATFADYLRARRGL